MVDLIDTIVYAGRIKDKSALMSSSSGGAFTALSDFFLKNDNAVVAAIYNYENHMTEFQMILDEKQRERAKGSKYMQSKPGYIYREAYRWLMENPKKELLFVGMGCQSDGFRKFTEIKGIRDRVYIVDIICHGSPSPKLWKEYAESIQRKDGKITYLTFKDKRNGWKSPTAYVKVNGAEKPIKDYVTLRTDSRIKDSRVKQSFVKNEIFEVGMTKMKRNNVEINIYSLERMLIELMRFRSKLPFDYYKEIISNYRNKAETMDFALVEEYADYFKNAEKLKDMIQMEVL